MKTYIMLCTVFISKHIFNSFPDPKIGIVFKLHRGEITALAAAGDGGRRPGGYIV